MISNVALAGWFGEGQIFSFLPMSSNFSHSDDGISGCYRDMWWIWMWSMWSGCGGCGGCGVDVVDVMVSRVAIVTCGGYGFGGCGFGGCGCG